MKEIDEWKLLGFLIGDRNSQDDFNMFSTEEHMGEETCTMLMQWQKMHPYASWTLLYQALIKINEKEMSQDILKEHLSGLLQVLYHCTGCICMHVHVCIIHIHCIYDILHLKMLIYY